MSDVRFDTVVPNNKYLVVDSGKHFLWLLLLVRDPNPHARRGQWKEETMVTRKGKEKKRKKNRRRKEG
jgi:hypothetical protein